MCVRERLRALMGESVCLRVGTRVRACVRVCEGAHVPMCA